MQRHDKQQQDCNLTKSYFLLPSPSACILCFVDDAAGLLKKPTAEYDFHESHKILLLLSSASTYLDGFARDAFAFLSLFAAPSYQPMYERDLNHLKPVVVSSVSAQIHGLFVRAACVTWSQFSFCRIIVRRK